MRLQEYFYDADRKDADSDYEKQWDVKKKNSNFTPPSGRDKWLDAYIENVKEDIIKGLKSKVNYNISKQEENAIKDLLNDDTIVIRPADKGSGIVILNIGEYNENIEKELKDKNTYLEVSKDPTQSILAKTKKLVNNMVKNGIISKELKQYLIPEHAFPGKVKGNPKIHKEGYPLRIIISGRETATEQVAEIAEKELNQFVVETPSYIKDTTHFLNEIKHVQNLPEHAILFCFDVEKLYPSIPKLEGLEACREALRNRRSKKIPDEDVIQMIQLVLENNNFEFNGKHYIQIDGTAIGSKLGRNYACTYMRVWDRNLMQHHLQPYLYKRYIDDGFGIWLHGVETLEEFVKFANSIHPKIQVKLRWNYKKLEFLDMNVYLNNGRLETDLYCKKTDKHIYVHKDSDHPTHVKRAIPYGLGLRLRRICSDDDRYKHQRTILTRQLSKRGYKKKWINKELQKADQTSREDALKRKTKETSNERVPLVITYSSYLPNIHKIVNRNMNILRKSKRMTEIIKLPPIVAYRRGRNLSDILIHGKLNKQNKIRKIGYTSGPCEKDKCTTCRVMIPRSHFESNNKQIFDILRGGNCDTYNVVYLITCNKCGKPVYVGETGRAVRDRIKEHLWDIRALRDKPVASHFNSEGHSTYDIQFNIIEAVREHNTIFRRIREEFWINKLQTYTPFGLNIKTK